MSPTGGIVAITGYFHQPSHVISIDRLHHELAHGARTLVKMQIALRTPYPQAGKTRKNQDL
jgi:hypothetical protein